MYTASAATSTVALKRVIAANRFERSAAAAIRLARSRTSAWSSGPNRRASVPPRTIEPSGSPPGPEIGAQTRARVPSVRRRSAAAGSATRSASSPVERIVGPSVALAGTSQLPRLLGAMSARRRTTPSPPSAAATERPAASWSSSSMAHQSAIAGTMSVRQARDRRFDVRVGAQHVARAHEECQAVPAPLERLARPPVPVPRERAVERLRALVREPDREITRAVMEVLVRGEPEDDGTEHARPGDQRQDRDRPVLGLRRSALVAGCPDTASAHDARSGSSTGRPVSIASREVRRPVQRDRRSGLGVGVSTDRDDLDRRAVVRDTAHARRRRRRARSSRDRGSRPRPASASRRPTGSR